ncbi:hypothetical protein CDAR_547151 [Caerostris darwini]|uniref:Uncharacterized protein n=1 Tax=Caerostris darwini TaxID=1538125 RepID=A0AAV4PVF9_9ARAC|nr:hypothetical protein CDAR_547151 [Caerostris darwini]
MGPAKRNKRNAIFKIKVIEFTKENGNLAEARMFDVSERKMNRQLLICLGTKCALHKGVTKWSILEESVANWVLENCQNGFIVTRKVYAYLP